MENVVSTLAPSFLIGSSSYLQVTRTSITSRTSSKFGGGGGKAALGFGPDRIGTLVSMATDSSHRVIMGKML